MEYMLLYFIALAFLVFATFQDLKRREIANWINYSLLAVGLLGKAFISVSKGDYMILIYSLIGALLFYGIALVFYYSNTFGGGDARLLVALGAFLPYDSFLSLALLAFCFIFLILLVGAAYTLIYSVFLVFECQKNFLKEFINQAKSHKVLFIIVWVFVAILFIIFRDESLMLLALALLFISPILFSYLKAVEKNCLIVLMNPKQLTEGDWLYKEARVGKEIVSISVHGLSHNDIAMLRKSRKKVWIRHGIPFVPVFLGSWIIMVFFFWLFGTEVARIFSLFFEFFGVF